MFFSDQTIAQYIDEGKIIIGPKFDKKNIRPVGIRLHLGRKILVPEPNQIVQLIEPINLKYTTIDLTNEKFYLEPGQFALASTYETIKTLPDILVLLDGRSTIARLGLTIHITAAIIDGVYEKPHSPTLEIKNVGNFKIQLQYKDPITMMLFAQLKDPVKQKLQTQYQINPHEVAPPNLQFKTGFED